MWLLMSCNGSVNRISYFDKLRLSRACNGLLYIKAGTLCILWTSFSRSGFKSLADDVHVNLTFRSFRSFLNYGILG